MLNGGHNEEALAAVEKELSTKTQVITCLGSVAEEKTAATIVQKTGKSKADSTRCTSDNY